VNQTDNGVVETYTKTWHLHAIPLENIAPRLAKLSE